MPAVEIARFTERLAETVAFYEAALGREADRKDAGSATFLIGEVELFLHRAPQPDDERTSEGGQKQPPDEDHIAFACPNLDETVGQLREAGWRVELDAADYPWGRSAYLRDPDGRLVELWQR
jgi:catechol 2,3-dioxygenase-like lactoylglutathione lyase family enzyme